MKIEYLKEGSHDCPLIRIYGNEPGGFSHLIQAFRELCCGTRSWVALQNLPSFESVGGCALTGIVGQKDKGVSHVRPGQDFEWVLTRGSWETVVELTEPFIEPRDIHIHQWLAGKEARFGLDDSEISVLISNSKDGRW